MRADAAQHSTAQHSTAQHSTAQHSAAQHSTAPLTSPPQPPQTPPRRSHSLADQRWHHVVAHHSPEPEHRGFAGVWISVADEQLFNGRSHLSIFKALLPMRTEKAKVGPASAQLLISCRHAIISNSMVLWLRVGLAPHSLSAYLVL